MSATAAWKASVLKRLQQRKLRQETRWSTLVTKCGGFAAEAKTLRDANETLTDDLAAVKRERNTLRTQVEAVRASGGAAADASALLRVKEIEQELADRNNDLRVLYKEKGEHLKALLDGETEAKAAKRAAAESDARASDLAHSLSTCQAQLATAQLTISDMATAKLIMDQELTAIQMAYVGLEEAHSKLQREYDALLERMLAKAAEDADRMNEANSFYETMMQRKKATANGEAAAAAVSGVVDAGSSSMSELRAMGASELPTALVCSVRAHDREGFFLDYNVSGDTIATGGGEATIHVFGAHPTAGDRPSRLPGFSGSVTSVAYSLSHELLLGSSADKSIRLFSSRSERSHHVLTGHSAKVQRAVFSPSGNVVASGSADRTIKLWDVDRGTCLKTLSVPKSVQDLVMSPDGTLLIAAYVNGAVMSFDVRTGEPTGTIQVTDAGHLITSLDVRAEALLVNVRDSVARAYDFRTAALLAEYRHPGFTVATNSSRAAFSTDGQTVAAGSGDGALYLWGRGGEFKSAVMGIAEQAITGVCWRPSGRGVAALSKRGDLLIFE